MIDKLTIILTDKIAQDLKRISNETSTAIAKYVTVRSADNSRVIIDDLSNVGTIIQIIIHSQSQDVYIQIFERSDIIPEILKEKLIKYIEQLDIYQLNNKFESELTWRFSTKALLERFKDSLDVSVALF